MALSPYAGDGTPRNRFRPLVDGAWIDLRPDCTRKDGFALVNTDERVRILKLGEGFKDTFGTRIRNRVHNLMGVDVSRVKRFDVLAAKLLLEPNGWKPLRPTAWRYEIWLGGLVWEFPLVRGGASDNFNRADETPLASPWVKPSSLSNSNLSSQHVLLASFGTTSMYYYTSAASTDDQYSELDQNSSMSNGYRGPAVRISTSVATGTAYCFVNAADTDSPDQGYLFKKVAGVETDIISPPASPAKAVPMRLEANGSSVSAMFNSANVAGSPVTDTAVTTGQPGMYLANSTADFLDDWQGADLAAPSGPVVAWITA